jgi:hypothetical protein
VNTEAGPRIILRLPERWLTRYTISEEISPKLCGIGLGFGPGVTFAADQNFGAKSAIADGVYTGQPINFRQSLLDCQQTGSYRRQSAERNKNRCCFVFPRALERDSTSGRFSQPLVTKTSRRHWRGKRDAGFRVWL